MPKSFLILCILSINCFFSCSKKKVNDEIVHKNQYFNNYKIVYSTAETSELECFLKRLIKTKDCVVLKSEKIINGVKFVITEGDGLYFEVKKNLLFLDNLKTIDDIEANISSNAFFCGDLFVLDDSDSRLVYHIYTSESNTAYRIYFLTKNKKIIHTVLLY